MIYVVGFIGFVLGFGVGQMVLFFLLRHKSNAELLNNFNLKLVYGLLNWGFAGIGLYLFVNLYQYYFPVT